MDLDTLFGKISPPPGIENLVKKGGDPATAAGGIGAFLNNVIQLIYSLSGVILIFMIIYAAIQWMSSGGDKEAIAKARARIIHAIIGIILLALAFLISKYVGIITGFPSLPGL